MLIFPLQYRKSRLIGMLRFASNSPWILTKATINKLVFQKSFQQMKKKKSGNFRNSESHFPKLLKLYSFQHKMQWIICRASTLCFSGLGRVYLFTVLVITIINTIQAYSNIWSTVWTFPRVLQTGCSLSHGWVTCSGSKGGSAFWAEVYVARPPFSREFTLKMSIGNWVSSAQ